MFTQPQNQFWHDESTDEIKDDQPRLPYNHINGWQRHSPLHISFDSTEHKSITAIGIEESTAELPIVIAQNFETLEDEHIDRALFTRNLCYIGLTIGWAVAITCLVFSALLIKYKSATIPSWLVGKLAQVGPNGYSWVPVATIPEQTWYLPNHRAFHVPHGLMVIISLMLNVGLTLIFDMINHIHGISLRWQLWSEGKLDYNSNPRLFSSTKRHGPNKWYSNLVSALAIIISYGGLSVLDFPITVLAQLESTGGGQYDVTGDFDGPHYGIDFNGWGFLALGTGLFLQSFISSWCLIQTSRDIGTWSSHPLEVAKVCKQLVSRRSMTKEIQKVSSIAVHELSRFSPTGVPNFSLVRPFHRWPAGSNRASSVYSTNPMGDAPLSGDSEEYKQYGRPSTHGSYHPGTAQSQSFSPPITYSLPQKRQPNMGFFIPQCKRIVIILWAITALATIWTIVVAVISAKAGTTTRQAVDLLFPFHETDGFEFLTNFGQIAIGYDDSIYDKSREWIGMLVQIFTIALPIIGVHYAEVILQLSRDEAIWRRASTAKGVDTESMVLLENARYWPFWIFFILKCLIPWIYGFAITSFTKVTMSLIPLSMFTSLFWMLTIFLQYMIRRQPEGPQPPTYGNLEALMKSVEDWSKKKLYWGDKGERWSGVRLAGTAGHPLPALHEGLSYTGLQVRIPKARVGRTMDLLAL